MCPFCIIRVEPLARVNFLLGMAERRNHSLRQSHWRTSLTSMDKDGMAVIRLGDCKLLLEIFCIHSGTHSLVEEEAPCLLILWKTLENQHRNAGQSASQT